MTDKRLLWRLEIFILLFSLACVFVYAAGMRQGAGDAVLLGLTAALRIAGMAMAITAAAALLASLLGLYGGALGRRFAGMFYFLFFLIWGVIQTAVMMAFELITGGVS